MSSRRGFLKGLVAGVGAAAGLASTDCLVRLASASEVKQLVAADPVILPQLSEEPVHQDMLGRLMFMQDPRGNFIPVGVLASIDYQREIHDASSWTDSISTMVPGLLRAEGRVVFTGPAVLQVRS